MTDAIIVALITATASIIGQWLIYRKQRTDAEVKRAVKDKEMSDRLTVIERKLDEHNGYAEKLGDIAVAIVKLQKDVEYIKGEK